MFRNTESYPPIKTHSWRFFYFLKSKISLFLINVGAVFAPTFLSVISEYLNILSAHIAPECANNNFCKKNTFLIIFLINQNKEKRKNFILYLVDNDE